MKRTLSPRPLHAIVIFLCWLEPLTFASRLSKQPLTLNDVPNSQPQMPRGVPSLVKTRCRLKVYRGLDFGNSFVNSSASN